MTDFIEEAQSKTRTPQRTIAKKGKARASEEDPKTLDKNNVIVKTDEEKQAML